MGAVSFLIALLGGGFEFKDFKLPSKVGTRPRIAAGLFSGVFILSALFIVDEVSQSVDFHVRNALGQGQVREELSIFVGGKTFELTVDTGHRESRVPITVPSAGSYRYQLTSTTWAQDVRGSISPYRGTGGGTIQVSPDALFDAQASWNGQTFDLTLIEVGSR